MASKPEPFAPGSLSLGLHPRTDLDASAQIDGLLTLATVAEAAGFDGVTISEHHNGFPTYLPQPVLVCSWLLAATETVWCAPAPLLLGLRNPRLVAEELAWLAARHPGRVAAAFAPGYTAADYEALGIPFADRTAAFAAKVEDVVRGLGADGPLDADAAVRAWRTHAPALLSAANSAVAVRRAAVLGLGLIYPGGEDPDRLGTLTARYHDAGGRRPVVWIARVGFDETTPNSGTTPDPFRAAAAPGMRQADGFAFGPATGSPDAVVTTLVDATRRAGADGINIRLVAPERQTAELVADIRRIGSEVLPRLRAAFDRA